MGRNKSRGILLSGLILAGFPLMAIAKHRHIETQDIRFEVPSVMETKAGAENVGLWSEINALDLNELSGTDNIKRWDTVYVHMATGPGLIAYPFGISKDRPVAHKDNRAFSIRGKVMKRDNKTITVRYNFETFLPSQNLKSIVTADHNDDLMVELAVNDQSVARLVALTVDGVRYPYKMIETPVLSSSLTFRPSR